MTLEEYQKTLSRDVLKWIDLKNAKSVGELTEEEYWSKCRSLTQEDPSFWWKVNVYKNDISKRRVPSVGKIRVKGCNMEKRHSQSEIRNRVDGCAGIVLKNDGSIDLQLSLYDEQEDIKISNIRRISEDIVAGRSKVDRLTGCFEKGRIDGGRILVEISLIGAIKPIIGVNGKHIQRQCIEGALPKYYVPELSNDRAAHERLGQLAEHYLIKNDDELFGRFDVDENIRIDYGSESIAFYTKDNHVVKKRKLDFFEPIDYADNIALVNTFFPEAGITIEGFMMEDGVTYVIERQKRIDGETLDGEYDLSFYESITRIDRFFEELDKRLESEFGIKAKETLQRIGDNTYTNRFMTFSDAKYDNFVNIDGRMIPIDVTIEQIEDKRDLRVMPIDIG